jgi:nitrate/nitrite transporter NarK
LGGDSFFVGKASIVSRWFKGGELAFAFGITLSVGRIGSLVNGYVIPTAATNYGVPYALFIGFYLCLASFIGTFCVIALDCWAKQRDHDPTKI